MVEDYADCLRRILSEGMARARVSCSSGWPRLSAWFTDSITLRLLITTTWWASHAIFAAEFTNPQHPQRILAIKRILGAYNLDQNINAEEVAVMLDRFAACLD